MASENDFSIRADLPTGVLSIAASAGTGKTYALAGLATRFLAEGRVSAADLLMVTFTRAATGELRSRVRDRLVESATHLECVLADPRHRADDDDLLTWLSAAENPAGDVPTRLEALRRAISEFDSATITTIHGFAAQVLGALGVGAGVDPDVTFAENIDQLVVEVCSDLLASAAIDPTLDADLPTWTTFITRTRHAVASPDLVVTPAEDDAAAKGADRLLASMVRRAVAELRDRRRNAGTQSFDDLLVRLRDALGGDGAGSTGAATDSIRRRFRVALIDEFQDTDPVQWGIFRTLFVDQRSGPAGGIDDDTALVLVGDPKQAIYSFRGADVRTYLDAVAHDSDVERRALATNWRADDAVVAATGSVFDGAEFGDGIMFARVTAAPRHVGGRLLRHDGSDRSMPSREVAALDLRCVDDPELLDDTGHLRAGPARDAVFDDLVRHVVDLLDHGSLPDPTPSDSTGGHTPVRPGGIALLVRSNKDAQRAQDELHASGVPAVLARGATVVESPAADQLMWLLDALVAPADQRRVRTFAVSWFGGRDAEWVADATEVELAALSDRLHSWTTVLTAKGVVELFRTVWRQTQVVPRVLATPDGDRNVTDLEHLGELLRTGAGDTAVSAGGLLALLADLRAGQKTVEDVERDTDVTSRRVETDAEAVQIMTVWVAKGLEFPVVLCPTLWSRPNHSLDYHDPDGGHRVFDVRTKGKLLKADKWIGELATEENDAEDMRLLYVALTRAAHHTAVWWADSGSARATALGRVLFRELAGPIPEVEGAGDDGDDGVPDGIGALAEIAGLLARGDGHISAHAVTAADTPPPRWSDPHVEDDRGELRAAAFLRPAGSELERSRARWSFSAVVSRDRTHGDPWDASIDDEGADDEQRPPDVGLADTAEAPVSATGGASDGGTRSAEGDDSGASPLAFLPAGAAFGTLAHDVLERVDFAKADLADRVAEVVAEQQRWRSLSLRKVGDERPMDDPAAQAEGARLLAEGVRQVIETPLGPLFADEEPAVRRLADIPTSDRLDELSFVLALGGDGPAATDQQLAEVLADHLDAGDPFRPWARMLARGAFEVSLAGHLTGSIDAVIRLPGDRFVVVDYKSNRLHAHGVAPRAGDYGQAPMVRSMVEHHYPLQALLYQVALHRYLRWRIPDYDPATHLGGSAYLFLRGMTGAAVASLDGTPVGDGGAPEGVCTWSPPAAAIEDVSDLLAGVGPVPAGAGKDAA